MKTIWKYPLVVGRTELAIPGGAVFLSVQTQHSVPTLWVLCDPENPLRQRVIDVYGTGFRLPENPGRFISTFFDGPFVWHAFERESA